MVKSFLVSQDPQQVEFGGIGCGLKKKKPADSTSAGSLTEEGMTYFFYAHTIGHPLSEGRHHHFWQTIWALEVIIFSLKKIGLSGSNCRTFHTL